jgi:hypothetical protein
VCVGESSEPITIQIQLSQLREARDLFWNNFDAIITQIEFLKRSHAYRRDKRGESVIKD